MYDKLTRIDDVDQPPSLEACHRIVKLEWRPNNDAVLQTVSICRLDLGVIHAKMSEKATATLCVLDSCFGCMNQDAGTLHSDSCSCLHRRGDVCKIEIYLVLAILHSQVQLRDNLIASAFKIIEIQSVLSDSLRRWQKHIFASTNFSQKTYVVLYLQKLHIFNNYII